VCVRSVWLVVVDIITNSIAKFFFGLPAQKGNPAAEEEKKKVGSGYSLDGK
jgi:hypothetical protein